MRVVPFLMRVHCQCQWWNLISADGERDEDSVERQHLAANPSEGLEPLHESESDATSHGGVTGEGASADAGARAGAQDHEQDGSAIIATWHP